MKAYAAACDRNKAVILEVLKRYLNQTEPSPSLPLLLEVGSGTGQHSIYFSQALPQLRWQPSDRAEQLDDIRAWQQDEPQANNLAPLELDLNQPTWPVDSADHIFTANTLHIVSLALVQRFVDGAKATLNPRGYLFIYGPFNCEGKYTSDSNAEFDIWLQQRDTNSGIRDFEFIHQALTADNCCKLIEDVQMPANNRMLVYQKNH